MLWTTATHVEGVVYVVAGRMILEYQAHCAEAGIAFEVNRSVRPPLGDDSTLFLTAGMQRFKPLFSDQSHIGTIANSQTCLRLNDLDEVGDITHCLMFDMLGLFSFREMSMADAISFWHRFLQRIGVTLTHVTVHPDRIDAWRGLHPAGLEVRPDADCTWSDGAISGYCTEFFVGDVEIGNIVNPLGTCIDVGFGLQRLMLVLGEPIAAPATLLAEAITTLLESGYRPGNKGASYAVRRLLRALWRQGGSLDHPAFREEITRQQRLQQLYQRIRHKHHDRSADWWYDTHGIVLADVIEPD